MLMLPPRRMRLVSNWMAQPPLPVALCVAVDCRKSQSAGVKTLRQALADEHKRLRERLAVRALASIRVSCVRL